MLEPKPSVQYAIEYTAAKFLTYLVAAGWKLPLDQTELASIRRHMKHATPFQCSRVMIEQELTKQALLLQRD